MPKITLPLLKPRKYQLPILRALDSGCKRAVWVCHRRCLEKGTHVLLENGNYIEIENIKSGDKILSFNGSEVVSDTVIDKWSVGLKKVGIVKSSGIKDLKCTKDHRFAYLNHGKISWKEISKNNKSTVNIIYTGSKEGVIHDPDLAEFLGYKKINFTMTDEQVECFDIETKEHHNFFANGYLVHNSGKDLTIWNWVIKSLVQKKQSCFYILPTYSQAKKIIWEGMTKDGIRFLEYIPKSLIEKKSESELSIRFKNGSYIQLVGSDNYDRLVGTNPNICVFSEMAIQNPTAWEYMRPILAENNGVAIFISCVTPDTLVITENGLTRIKDVSSSREEFSELNKNIWGLGGFHNANQFYYSKKVPTLKIMLSSGYKLECSHIHPIWNGFEWIKAKDLKEGNLIPIEYGQDIWGKGIDFSTFHNNTHKSVKYKFDKDNIPDDLFYLFGLINGDGYFSDTYVIIANQDREIVDFLHKFGFKPERGGTHHRLGSTELCSLLNFIGFKKGAKNKSIPEKLFRCTKEQMKSFLQGLFDSDGTSHSNPKYHGRIKFTSSCEKLIDEVKILLLNFGIVSSFTHETKPPTKLVNVTSEIYNLEINSFFAWEFYTKIGFRVNRKQNNYIHIPDNLKNDSGNIYPIQESNFKNYNLSLHGVVNPTRISRRKIKELNNKNPHPSFEEALKYKFFYSPIKSIEHSESEVFDFVIPETHSFFSNGFISHNTPRGRNKFWDIYNTAENDPNWFCQRLTVDDTNAISKESIDKERSSNMSDEMIEQEFYCSFEIGQRGSYYGKYIKDMYKEKRIGNVPYDKNFLVYTAWDLGYSDSMSIVFYQKKGNDIAIIDFYENHGYPLLHYIELLKSKNYQYGKHFVPIDATHHSRAGQTFIEAGKELDIHFTPLKQEKSLYDGIERTRQLFHRLHIDEKNCEFLIRCLLEYHSEFDNNAKVFKNVPKHNWASHAADSVRYLSLSLESISKSGMSKETLSELKRSMNYL